MKDRLAKYPGRYTAIVDTEKIEKGIPFNIEITRDDEPTVEGTPYNKESVLPDSAAEAICPNVEDPTPADAFMALFTGRAPAGYGLGDASSPSTSWNTSSGYGNGYIRGNSGSPDGEWWYGLNIKYDKAITTQLAFKRVTDKSSPIIAVRHRPDYGDATPWMPWEYVNPPMVEGVAYRTTERFKGKPVYARYLNCGALPNATSKEIFVANNISEIVRVEGYLKNTAGYLLQAPISGTSAVSFYLYNNTNLRLTTATDQSTWDAYVTVYYTLAE